MISALAPVVDNTTLSYFYNQFNISVSENASGSVEGPVFPSYIRTASMIICIMIMVIGVVGNVMVPLVILKSKDMRNSTNIFLINLSLADLLVLLVCTPTVLVEVNSRPETWVLGQEMCKAVPFVELTVAHASVLTILAISFERYYAICEPLKAGYVCTKARAFIICLLAWTFAAIFTSPILVIAEYEHMEYFDGSMVPVCLTQANAFWPALFFIMTISVFFLLPLCVLLALYTVIARHLMAEPCTTSKSHESFHLRARKQVVLMLGTVVLSFFLCLMPFRVLTLWIVVDNEALARLGIHHYYNLLYFSRIMLYLNSAVNPILYNIMSSKFRDGFMRLCGLRKRGISLKSRQRWVSRNGTINNTTLTSLSYSSTRRSNNNPNSWRSQSRMSIDSRTGIVHSPERVLETSPSLGHKRLVRRADANGSDSPELRRHQSDTSFNVKAPPKLTRNQSAGSPRLTRHQSGTSFRKSVIIRSTMLNSRSNGSNGVVKNNQEEEKCLEIRPSTESFV